MTQINGEMITVNQYVVLLECCELYYTLIILNLIDIYKWFSSLWRRAKTQNVTLESLLDGQLVKTWLTVDEDT